MYVLLQSYDFQVRVLFKYIETFALPVKCMLSSNLETFAQQPDADMSPCDDSHPIHGMFNYFHQILQFVFQVFLFIT